MLTFDIISKFEHQIANYFGASYCIAVDCCTHAIELCLRLKQPNNVITIPKQTYISIPFTLIKLGLKWQWHDIFWKNYYYLTNTNIVDAAVTWKKNSYIPNTLMCISFQHKKHLCIGKGGAILTDNVEDYKQLKLMSYDGRQLNNVPWYNQNISTIGYHYYMTPELALRGIEIFEKVKDIPPKLWTYKDYPDLTKMSVFK